MKRTLLTLLAVLFVLALLAAAGFAGYRTGFNQGILAAAGGEGPFLTPRGFGFGAGPQRMPMHELGFRGGWGPGGFGMHDRGFGFGIFSLFGLLARLLFWCLVIWAIYMLVTRSGWRLTRTTTASDPPAPPAGGMENRE